MESTYSQIALVVRNAVWFTCCVALLIVGRISSAIADDGVRRTTQGLLALYQFAGSKGVEIPDQSGEGTPLNLKIEQSSGVVRSNGGLMIKTAIKIVSVKPATKISDAVKRSGEFTVEAWVIPLDDKQSGPARIVSLSSDPGQRNFTLGQDGNAYDVRFRTSSTDKNGNPSLKTSKVIKSELTHVVYTREKSGATCLYLNGQLNARGQAAGDLAGWSNDFRLSLANELTGDRPWLGELRLVAIYGQALTGEEIAKNFSAGVQPDIDYAALLPPPVKRQVGFVADVQPILREYCFECHSKGNEEGGLNLGIRSRVLEGGEHGPIMVVGKSAESRLIQSVSGLDKELVMPPDGDRLTPEQVGILRAWIDQGADWPAGADVLDPKLERARQHWAFQALRTIEPPAVKDATWSRNEIDRFILAKQEGAGLQPTAPISPRGFIRRATFDVVGLPPSPEEIAEYLASSDQDASRAVTKLVDRLLASSHYGERWGRHWLDIARYADSDGEESDDDRPLAWHYRDFVIQALNEDMPFDQFVRWQLAGDEYEPQNPNAVAATGFITAGPYAFLEARFIEEERLRNRYNELDDIMATTGKAMLALTIGCAKCHDHKYDAISAREYYRLMAAFHSGERAQIDVGQPPQKVLGWRDMGPEPKTTWLFKRGDFFSRDQIVHLGFLEALSRGKSVEEYSQAAAKERPLASSTYQRRALAEWMTDAQQGAGPLVARVIVNRVWQHHFGVGLVRTVDDFGTRSDPPSHPELLEWLANDLVANCWKLKRLHRLILTSATYHQGTQFDAARHQADPDNKLLWRMRPRRIEAEILRDAMLVAGGTLNREAGGPGFKAPIESEAMTARNVKTPYPKDVPDSPAVRRRSVYMFHKRVVPHPLLQVFDRPDLLQSCGRRDATIVAPQALAILNDKFVRTCASDFANRLWNESGHEPTQLVTRAFELALGRTPNDVELQAAIEFLNTQSPARRAVDAKLSDADGLRQALVDLCHTVFGLNEFVYVD